MRRCASCAACARDCSSRCRPEPASCSPSRPFTAPGDWIERFERAGLVVWEDELYELGDDGWRSVPALSPGLRYGERGPGASAVLCAELRPKSFSATVRLAVRDRRYRDVRRVTG